jgi:membrane-associated phospholipid phosphatase
MAAVTVVSWVALLQYWRRARELYLGASIAWVTYLVVAGPRVGSALGHALDILEAMAAGALLALVYLSDLRKVYETPPQAA